ncbi:MAG: serine hydrolase [bacterium]|nr:serine hydrolase [bacterium]
MHRSYRNKIILLTSTLCFLLVAELASQSTIPDSRGEIRDSLKYRKRLTYFSDNPKIGALDLFIDSILRKYMQSPHNCGISIGLNQNGRSHFYNYGESKRDSGNIPTQSTVYEIGAISNSFCGLLLAQAVLEKKIKMNDDIRRYLPVDCAKFAFYKSPILIKHLAAHTASLPRLPSNLRDQNQFDSLNPFKNYTKELLFKSLQNLSITNEPGTVRAYSALGIGILAAILEEIYGQTFEEIVHKKIAAPYNMANTQIQSDSSQRAVLSSGYDENGDPAPPWSFGEVPAMGGIASTTGDMLKYLGACATPNELNRMAQQVLYSGREEVSAAWSIKATQEGNTLYWQNGGTAGFSAFCGFIPEKNLSFVLLANSGMNLDYLAIAISKYLQK